MELQWANPSIKSPLREMLGRALAYLRVLLFSKDPTHWLTLCQKLTDPERPDYSIAHRWRSVMGQDWDSLPDRPSPLVVDMATKQLSIESSLERRATSHAIAHGTHRTRLFVNFPAKGKAKAPRRQTSSKRGRPTTIEPLRSSDAPGYKASIQQIMARSEPRRIRHGRRSTWVEEFLVRWAPEHCTFGEAPNNII